MKNLYLLSALLIISTTSYSQNKFTREFVVTIKGDTLFGTTQISDRNFKNVNLTNASGQVRSFASVDISCFFNTKWGFFVTATVVLDISKEDQIQILSTDPVHVFLELLITTNDISIFYFKNSEYGEHYFIQKEQGKFDELILRRKITTQGGKSVYLTDEQYKVTLNNYLNDCPNIKKEVAKSSLSRKSLQGLLIQYSTCRDVTPSFKSFLDQGKLIWGAAVGWYTSSFKYSNTNSSTDVPYQNSAAMTFGISAEYLTSVRSRKTSILSELIYKSLETSGTTSSPYYYQINVYNYKADYLRLNTLFRYNFVKSHSAKPFLLLGISNSFVVSSNSKLSITTSTGTSEQKLETRSYEQGLLFGAGVNVKKIDIYARMEFSNGLIVPNNIDKLTAKSLYVGMTYRFGK